MISCARAQPEAAKHNSTGVANMLCNQIAFVDPCCYIAS